MASPCCAWRASARGLSGSATAVGPPSRNGLGGARWCLVSSHSDSPCRGARGPRMSRTSDLDSRNLPRHEATIVQTTEADLRIRVDSVRRIAERLRLGGSAGSKFELELRLAQRDRIATYAADRARAWAGEDATRLVVGSLPLWIPSRAFPRSTGASGTAVPSNVFARPRTPRAHHEGHYNKG